MFFFNFYNSYNKKPRQIPSYTLVMLWTCALAESEVRDVYSTKHTPLPLPLPHHFHPNTDLKPIADTVTTITETSQVKYTDSGFYDLSAPCMECVRVF